MKLIEKIKNTKLLLSGDIKTGDSCSVVGNSGALLGSEYGSLIDTNEDIIRFNNAQIDGFKEKVGSNTTFRILNCHYILNIDSESYFKHQKTRFPDQDRYLLYKFNKENLIFKTDPSWELWRKREILDKVEKNNNVFFIHQDFYNLGKKINNDKEATNGFIGLLLALKYYKKIECFGFSFYKPGIKKHYYDEVKTDPTNNHDFSLEEKWFSLLEKNKIIKIYK